MNVVQKAGPHSLAGKLFATRISMILTSARNCTIPNIFVAGFRESASDSDGYVGDRWTDAMSLEGSGQRVQVVSKVHATSELA